MSEETKTVEAGEVKSEEAKIKEAKELLAKTEQDIRQSCAKEITAVLEKYGLVLNATASINLVKK